MSIRRATEKREMAKIHRAKNLSATDRWSRQNVTRPFGYPRSESVAIGWLFGASG